LTAGEVAVVLVLATLCIYVFKSVMIPGGFFVFIIVMTEFRVKGFNYGMIPELGQW
jgi:hypothetical protein